MIDHTGQSHCEITDPEFFSFLFEKDQGSGRAVELLLQGKNSTGIRKFIRGLILMIDLAWFRCRIAVQSF